MAFHLEKPVGFKFKAGQYVDVTLINPPETDSQGIVRASSGLLHWELSIWRMNFSWIHECATVHSSAS